MKISGGDKLGPALAEIAAKLGGDKTTTLRVGFLEGATYPDGQSVASVAAFNEFGVPAHNQPPRPFFRGMVQAKSSGWPEAIRQDLKDRQYDAKATLDVVGVGIEGQLKQAINEFDGAPLSPKTIKRKGNDKQLIDRGVMIGSVGHDLK